MPLFIFGQSPTRSPHAVSTPKGRVVSRQHSLVQAANTMSSPGSGGMGSGSSGYQVDRYNPAYDRLEEGSVVEDWIPRDLAGINKMMRNIYYRDGIAGPALDIFSTIPWSSYDIVGIDDPALKRFYEEAAQVFGDNAEEMHRISLEYLMLGRYAASMLYNEDKGYWDDFMPHDPDFLTITPIPVRGYDPKLDLMLSPALRQFVMSQDYRDRSALQNLPDHLVSRLKSGRSIELDPLATLWCARRTASYDYVGTSIYTRIIPFWALEKALINATVTAARRRAGNILHVTAGLDDRWEPTTDEMEDIAGLFIQADEDPVGAVVVTRTGVDATEIRQGGSLWKMSDEWQYLAEGKMRALGISEALLSGEATYSNMEQARSVLAEQLKQLRNELTNQVFINRFRILARAHGFVRRSQAELNHRVRIAPTTNQPRRPPDPGSGPRIEKMEDLSIRDIPHDEALAIPDQSLIVPDIYWHKTMEPEADEAGLDLVSRLKEGGFPVTLRMEASRSGQDLDEILNSLDEDVKLREKVNEWKKKVSLEDDNMGFAALNRDDVKPGTSPLWDPNKRFMGLSWNEAVDCLADLANRESKGASYASIDEAQRELHQILGGDPHKMSAMSYLLMRMGFAPEGSFVVSDEVLSEIADFISKNPIGGKREKTRELFALARITSHIKNGEDLQQEERFEKLSATVATNRRDVAKRLKTEMAVPQKTLFSGV